MSRPWRTKFGIVARNHIFKVIIKRKWEASPGPQIPTCFRGGVVRVESSTTIPFGQSDGIPARILMQRRADYCSNQLEQPNCVTGALV